MAWSHSPDFHSPDISPASFRRYSKLLAIFEDCDGLQLQRTQRQTERNEIVALPAKISYHGWTPIDTDSEEASATRGLLSVSIRVIRG